jgi:hypothetical protein
MNPRSLPMVVKLARICRPPSANVYVVRTKVSWWQTTKHENEVWKKKSGWCILYWKVLSYIPVCFCEFCGWYILWCILCIVYSFTCGCRSFHEMEIPIMENCLSSVTLASAVIMAIFIFVYGIVYHQCLSLLTVQ